MNAAASTNDRIHFPDEVSPADRAEATRLMAAIDAAQTALTDFAAPSMGTRFNLGPGETVADWGGADQVPLVLVCPWCGQNVQQGDLYDRELAERRSYPSSIDGEEQTVVISYDSGSEFDSVTLVHEQCELPVSLPEGWDLDSA